MPEACAQRQEGVVVTGVAATACLGADAESIWREVQAGRCGMASMPALESPLPEGSVGGQAVDLPADYQPEVPREARYLRWTVEHALRDAGLAPGGAGSPAPDRCCAVLGTTLHGIRAGGRFLRSGNPAQLDSFLAGSTAALALGGLGIEGGAYTNCSACSSSLGAVALGVTLLETGQADLVVAGGYDAISEYAWGGFNALRLISPGPLRPFCTGRLGMKVAEGYGIVIIERAGSAAARGARVRAVLAGWGESADAHHLTQPHPQGEGALAAMKQALERASVDAREVDLVAAHATGTPDNDGAEYQALSRLFGGDLARVPVVGFKSFLGHTLGGAGAVELVLSSLALRDGRVPACPNVTADAVEYAGLNVAHGAAVDRDIGCTLNTSLGFGGANTCVVLSKPGRGAAHAAPSPSPEAWITGVGVVLPGVVGHAAFAQLVGDRHGAVDPGAAIDDAQLADYLNVRRARRLSQYVKYTLAAASMAVRDAGLADQPQRVVRANAMLGTLHGSANFCYEYYGQIVKDGAVAANPVLFAEGVPNAAAAHLSTTLGLNGACQTIIGSRTAGLDALALAALRIRAGVAETVIVVAAEERCGVVDLAYREAGLQALEGSERPARSEGRGFGSTGGGGVAFVVESSRAAAARGAASYASVAGSASWSYGSGNVARGVASALSRLPSGSPPNRRVVGSACGTWIDRAERLGARRAGVSTELESGYERFGELFTVTPLANIAAAFAGGGRGEGGDNRLISLCTDWTGAVTALTIDFAQRRLNTP